MKLYNDGNTKITNKEAVRLNGRNTFLFDVYRLVDSSWVFSGQFSGKTYKEAYEAYLYSAYS